MSDAMSDYLRVANEASEAEVTVDKLEALKERLSHELFGNAHAVPPDDVDLADADYRLLALIDVLSALSVIHADDPALPWSLASVLECAGQNAEAARVFLEAAWRSDRLAGHADALADEQDWARVARYHAATNFVKSGGRLTSAYLISGLPPTDQMEIRTLIAKSPNSRDGGLQ